MFKSNFNDFNIKTKKENKKQRIWTSKLVEETLNLLDNGYDVPTPFFEGNPKYRKGNIVFQYTQKELEEIKKCASDIVYFANTYCPVMTDEGYKTIKLRDYQERILRNFQKNRFNIVLAPRQIGKTITASIFLTWYLTFNYDKNVMLLANKGDTTREIMDKIRAIIEGLPFFLKAGIIKKDVMSMKFDNGCRIVAQNTTKNSGIGFTIHLLYLDEFAHVDNNIAEEFYGNIYPTISSSKVSRVIITSTPNGFNLFQRLWDNAVYGLNEYVPTKVDWWEVPGRDEEWKKREIANLGSEEEFNKQYGCQFISSSNLLLSSNELRKISANETEYVFKEIEDLDNTEIDYSKLKWKKDFDINEIYDESNYFVFSIDIAEGSGGDFTVLNIFKVVPVDTEKIDRNHPPNTIYEFFGLGQVGIWKDNRTSINDFTKLLYELSINVFYMENLRLVIEYNTYGEILIRELNSIYGSLNEFDDFLIVKYRHRKNSEKKYYGIKLNAEVKEMICLKFKEYVQNNRIILSESTTIDEAKRFGKNRKGTYQALGGHDDCIMSTINGSTFLETNDFKEIVEEYFDELDEEYKNKVNEILERDVDDDFNYNIYDILV